MKILPTLANIKKGEPYDIYIGRENKWLNLPESKWKNPFPMKKESERDEVILKHWNDVHENHPELIEALGELNGKVLGCYCFSSATGKGKRCHGHNLITMFQMYYHPDGLIV